MSARPADLDHLLDQARTKLPGSSDAGLKGELFDVFHEFFNDSDSWVETLSMPVVPGSVDYNVVPNSGQIVRLGGVLDLAIGGGRGKQRDRAGDEGNQN